MDGIFNKHRAARIGGGVYIGGGMGFLLFILLTDSKTTVLNAAALISLACAD